MVLPDVISFSTIEEYTSKLYFYMLLEEKQIYSFPLCVCLKKTG